MKISKLWQKIGVGAIALAFVCCGVLLGTNLISQQSDEPASVANDRTEALVADNASPQVAAANAEASNFVPVNYAEDTNDAAFIETAHKAAQKYEQVYKENTETFADNGSYGVTGRVDNKAANNTSASFLASQNKNSANGNDMYY